MSLTIWALAYWETVASQGPVLPRRASVTEPRGCCQPPRFSVVSHWALCSFRHQKRRHRHPLSFSSPDSTLTDSTPYSSQIIRGIRTGWPRAAVIFLGYFRTFRSRSREQSRLKYRDIERKACAMCTTGTYQWYGESVQGSGRRGDSFGPGGLDLDLSAFHIQCWECRQKSRSSIGSRCPTGRGWAKGEWRQNESIDITCKPYPGLRVQLQAVSPGRKQRLSNTLHLSAGTVYGPGPNQIGEVDPESPPRIRR